MTLRVCLRAKRPTWQQPLLFFSLNVELHSFFFFDFFQLHMPYLCITVSISRFVFFSLFHLFIVAQEICMWNPIFYVCDLPFRNSTSKKSRLSTNKKKKWRPPNETTEVHFFSSARLQLPSLIYFCFSVFNNENEHFSRVRRASWTTPKMNKNTYSRKLSVSTK